MKKILMTLVVIMITMIATASFGYQPPKAPANGWYVLDQAGKLSTEEVAKLNQKIEHLNKSTKNEFAILIVPDMGGDNIEDVAHATFNSWGVGKKDLDNGILIVIAIQERRSRIETGKGIGGEVPDLKANDIIGKHLTPHLKQGQFFAGLNETLDALSGNLDNRAQQPAPPPPKSNGCNVPAAGTSSSDVFGAVLALILCSIFALYVWARVRERAITKRFKQADYNIPSTNSYTRPHEIPIHENIALAKVRTTMVRPIKTVAVDSIDNLENKQREERAAYRQQLADESFERRRREREDKNRRKTVQVEEDQKSNYHFTSSIDTSSSSSSIFDWGSSSSNSSSSDSGSSFGGGDSGGGGSSSDW